MNLITSKGLAAKVVSLMQTGQRISGRRSCNFLTQNGLEAFDDEILNGGPTAGSSNFGSLQNAVGQIDCRFHKTINE